MSNPALQLEWLPGRYAVCRLDATEPIPKWAQAGPERSAGPGQPMHTTGAATTFSHSQECENVPPAASLLCITYTDQELSIVMDESHVPPEVNAERGFVAMRLVGVIDMTLIGIFAKLTGALAAAKVPVFVMSTYDTDYLMVREQYRDRAVAALSGVATFI
jgi:hypothetical protein